MNAESVASGATVVRPSARGVVPTVVADLDAGQCWLDAHLEPGWYARRFPNDKTSRRALRN